MRALIFKVQYTRKRGASQVVLVVKNSPANADRRKRHGFDPWMGKIPWRRAWQPTVVFLPGEFPLTEEPGGLQSMGSRRVRHTLSHIYKHLIHSITTTTTKNNPIKKWAKKKKEMRRRPK